MSLGTIIGAVGGGVSGLLGGLGNDAQNNAFDKANASQQAATQAQLQLGQQALGLNTNIYNSNYGLLSPDVSRGNVAGNQINALLGLPAAPAMTSPLAQGQPGSPLGNGSGYSGPNQAQINAMRNDGVPGNYQAATNALAQWRAGHPGVDPFAPAPPPAPATPPPATGAQPATTQPSAMDAFNQFANSAGMQFQQQQAANGLNNLYAGHSQLQSGAAMKAVPSYLQQQALSNYFMPYMGLLGQQQSTGAQAGSAIAGVGSNFGNTAASLYGNMGNALQGGADAASNSALLRGQNTANMYNNLGSSFGQAAGMFMSDRRLKTNIVKVGEFPDGLGIYEWNWKSAPDGEKVCGVIADEVEKLRPWAFIPNFRDGYDGVNYGALEAANAS
jgi:hypothetical protein